MKVGDKVYFHEYDKLHSGTVAEIRRTKMDILACRTWGSGTWGASGDHYYADVAAVFPTLDAAIASLARVNGAEIRALRSRIDQLQLLTAEARAATED